MRKYDNGATTSNETRYNKCLTCDEKLAKRNMNLSIFSNHHTIIGGCTAPVSDAGQFIIELAGVLLYHYVVLYQDPSGNEQRTLSPILSHCFENKGGENFTSRTVTNVSPIILIPNLSGY